MQSQHRNVTYIGAKIGLNVLAGLCIGSSFWNQGQDFSVASLQSAEQALRRLHGARYQHLTRATAAARHHQSPRRLRGPGAPLEDVLLACGSHRQPHRRDPVESARLDAAMDPMVLDDRVHRRQSCCIQLGAHPALLALLFDVRHGSGRHVAKPAPCQCPLLDVLQFHLHLLRRDATPSATALLLAGLDGEFSFPLSPFTYLVETLGEMLLQALCDANPESSMPPGQSCDPYFSAFSTKLNALDSGAAIAVTDSGYVQTLSDGSCGYCPFRAGDKFMESVSLQARCRYCDIGILCAYIFFQRAHRLRPLLLFPHRLSESQGPSVKTKPVSAAKSTADSKDVDEEKSQGPTVAKDIGSVPVSATGQRAVKGGTVDKKAVEAA